MGFPFEHGFQSAVVGMRLADRLGVSDDLRRDTLYACLLFYVGCTADSEAAARRFAPGALLRHFQPVIFGSPGQLARGVVRALADPEHPAPVRALEGVLRLPAAARGHRLHAVAMCEVAEMLASRLGAPPAVTAMFADFTARWDGKGLTRAQGEELPVALRIAHVARDACFQSLLRGSEGAVAVIRERSSGAFDPDVVTALTGEMLSPVSAPGAHDELLVSEPKPWLTLQGSRIDQALGGIGDFADLLSSYFTGHSAAVADLSARAAVVLGLSAEGAVTVGRAGRVHDIGRVAIETHAWNRSEALTVDEWERMRMHAHYTERVLAPSVFLSRLGAIAGAHHERIDGTGYHRGVAGPSLGQADRVLAAADTFCTSCEPRPHRAALAPEQASTRLVGLAVEGRLDTDAVTAVLQAAGQPVPRIPRPAGLTDREAQVVGLLAHGMQTKQIAHRLGISGKTADRHIQNAYGKMRVSTRAAATLFAMQHGLGVWGELPMADTTHRT
jgi:HD-GYP domain-containing protein (c-di-GMP phosphodiesterase class II)